MTPTIDMQVSPYDRGAAAAQGPVPLLQLGYRPRARWVPSRYNARTVGDDGRLILWNTLSGAISVFQAKDRERVLAALGREGVRAPLDPVGDYLSKRGFLVRDSVDELQKFRYVYARDQWRTDVLQLILLASEDCNFRCVYCYEKFKNGTMLPEVREGVKSLVRQRAPLLKELSAGWFGGEPLYGWEAVEELSPFLKETADRFGLAHAQNMTTNAYLLTDERAGRLLEWGCRQFQITIDGLPAQHDCKRVGRDGSPTYHVIMDNLRALRERPDPYSVAIRVNFDRENAPELLPFLEVLSEDFGGDPRFKLRFRAVGKWGGPNDDQLNTCGVPERKEVLGELRRKAGDVGLRLEGGIREIAKPGTQVCYAARPYSFIVGATGKLMKCTIALDEMDENVVGQLHPDGRMELVDEHMARWVTPWFETDALCQSCYVLPGCQGVSCPLTRLTVEQRSCCSVKHELKHQMRYTLAEGRAAPATAAAVAGG